VIVKVKIDIDYILESIILLLTITEEILAISKYVMYTLVSIMTYGGR